MRLERTFSFSILAVVILLFLKGPLAIADESEIEFRLPSTLSLSFSRQGVSNHTLGLEFNYSSSGNWQYFLGVNNTRQVTEDESETIVSNISGGHLGLGSDPIQDWAFRLDLDRWRVEDEMMVTSARLDIVYNSTDWSFGASPVFRKIQLDNILDRFIDDPVESNSTGYIGSIDYYGLKSWTFHLSGGKYDYEKDIEKIDLAGAAFFFTPNAISLSYGLLEWEGQALISYSFARVGVNGGVRYTRSAIDFSEEYSGVFGLNIRVDPKWTIGIQAQRGASASGSLTLTYAF